ncbi:MAG: peptidase M61 [Acidobacteria bacterium]|nr:MAG: peptidase M61 [Acidobacteriota bacterium]PYS11802.1 MAG: peptidase M61 [Acidobacteriota bacterium]
MLKRLAGVVAVLISAVPSAFALPMTLRVDATEAPRKIYHVELNIPAAPGPVTLFYPKWIPGDHAPSGPVNDLAGLSISAAGRSLIWKRDSVELFAFHIDVPQGASSVDVKLDFLSPAENGANSSVSATSELAIVTWNPLILYPRGLASDDLEITAQLRLPEDWKFGTALPVAKTNGGSVEFKTVSLTTLIDSPVLAGLHFRRIDLSPGAMPAHYLDIAADTEDALNAPAELIGKYRKLVREARELFGATHYGEYHFLLALSDQIAHFGVEHHASSDDRSRENFLTDPISHLVGATLIPHEFVHSWNGKYRRPEGLATRDYEEPMKGDLLWIYEGFTEYLGWVLAARSGLISPESNRQFLALTTANLDNRAGREWRSLADTAIAAQLLYDARNDWESRRRGVDFYDEGLLIWLEADVTIRKQTQGRKSLDDFCRVFYGPPSGPPQVKPYAFESIVEALNSVLPYDWKGFFETRLNRTGTDRAPLGGLEAAGYRLAYVEEPSEAQRATEQIRPGLSVAYSIGLRLNHDGSIIDVLPEFAAARAGIGPGMKLLSVNENRYSADALREAIRNTRTGGPLEFRVANGRSFVTFKLDYHDGEKYPVLRRNAQPPLLDDILKPLIR